MSSTSFWIALYHGHVAFGVVKLKFKPGKRLLGLLAVFKLEFTWFTAFPIGINIRNAKYHVFDYNLFIFCIHLWAFGKVASNSGIIHLGYFILLHQIPELIARTLILGEEHDSRGLPVQTVHCFDFAFEAHFIFWIFFLIVIPVTHFIFKNTL